MWSNACPAIIRLWDNNLNQNQQSCTCSPFSCIFPESIPVKARTMTILGTFKLRNPTMGITENKPKRMVLIPADAEIVVVAGISWVIAL